MPLFSVSLGRTPPESEEAIFMKDSNGFVAIKQIGFGNGAAFCYRAFGCSAGTFNENV